jgi:CHAT domain-containing protein
MTLPTARTAAALALLPVALAAREAAARPWILLAQEELTCLGIATPADRRPLDGLLLRAGAPADVVVNYFALPIGHDRTLMARLTLLGSLAYFADTDNDQVLRGELLADLERAAGAARERNAIFRQIERCTRMWRISSSLERGDSAAVLGHTRALIGLYGNAAPGAGHEDLPLVHAARELSVGGHDTALRELTAVLERRAAALDGDAARAGRMLATAASARAALGDWDAARSLAERSVQRGSPAEGTLAAWRAFPALYDGLRARGEPGQAAAFAQNMQNRFALPGALPDNELEYEILARLAAAADERMDSDNWAALQAHARGALIDVNRRRLSIPRFRQGLVATLLDPKDVLHTVLRRDPAWADEAYVNGYRGGYDNLAAQAANLFQPQARERMFLAYRIDDQLRTLAVLHEVLPRRRAEIEDITFRYAQLRAFSRIMPATVASAVRDENLSQEAQARVGRFLAMQARYALGLRNLWTTLDPDGAGSYNRGQGRTVFVTLDVLHEETNASMGRYVETVRRDAPRLAEYLTPSAFPLARVRSMLQPGEALVSTLVTHERLFVWALSPGAATFRSVDLAAADVADLVRDLRLSLTATSVGGTLSLPPFAAGPAHRLYQATLGQVADVLDGARHVLWHGHGPLASLPPAALVMNAPPADRIADAERLAGLQWPVDRFAFSTLTDVTLLPVHRSGAGRAGHHTTDYVGVGAPMMSPEELRQRSTARSFELAGGLDAGTLADLPKLPEAAEELRRLEDLFGTDRSVVLLGPDATEPAVRMDGVLRGARVVVFATHGFTTGEVAGMSEPALLMALPARPEGTVDGLLTATEIASLQLDAELVVLSACNTAAPDGRPDGETFTGLSQAFLYAGARALLVSHWPVASNASADLSVGLLERTRAGAPLAESLRATMLALREEGRGDDIRAHPFFWAPFVLVGDGAAALRWGGP